MVGFDDSPLIAFTDPPLTTVRQPVLSMGHAAVSALVGEINGTPASRTELKFHPELIVRGSTGAAPGPDLGRCARPGPRRTLTDRGVPQGPCPATAPPPS